MLNIYEGIMQLCLDYQTAFKLAVPSSLSQAEEARRPT